MPWAVDQADIGSAAAAGFSTSIAMTTTADVAAGSWIVVAVQNYQAFAAFTGVSGGGLTWELVASGFNSAMNGALYRAHAPSGLASGATITASFDNAELRAIAASAFSGGGAGSALEDGQAGTGTGTGWSSASLTSDTASALVVCHAYGRDGPSGSTPTSPAVEDVDIAGGTTVHRLVIQHQIAGAAGSYSTAGTWDASPSGGWLVLAGAFQDAGETGPYVGAGAAATAASGNVTPALPGSLEENDALILDITALDNVDCSVAVSGGSGNGWTRKAAHNNGSSLRKEVWWKRRGASDTDTAAAVTHSSGGKIVARVHAVRVPGTGDPFEASAGPSSVSAGASGAFPDVTTVNDDAVLFYTLGYAEDFTAGPAISNAQGLTLTERDETEVT